MKYREIIQDVVEAVNYVPRNYVLVWLRPGTNNKIAFGPAYEMKANIMRSYWPSLAKRIGQYKNYKKSYREYVVLGRHISPLFEPVEELMEAEDPAALFREKVKKKEGTYITDLTPGEAVMDIERRGGLLSGRVRSKSGREPYRVNIRNIFVTPEGMPDIYETACQCMEHVESMGKGHKYVTFVWDVHPTALVNEVVSRRLNPTHLRKPVRGKGIYRGSEFFHPFEFVSNWTGERGQLLPISEDMAMLEIDIAADYYFNGSTYGEINRKLFQLPEIYTDPLVRAASAGQCRFEMLRHGSERREEKDRQLVEAEKHILNQVYSSITAAGYAYDSLCLEIGRPAIRFEGRENVLIFVPGRVQKEKYRPPFYVTRPKPDQRMTREQMCSVYSGDENPFRILNIKKDILDDSTKKLVPSVLRAATTLILPEMDNRALEIDIPPEFERVYRSIIRKYSPDADRDLKKARLFYQRMR